MEGKGKGASSQFLSFNEKKNMLFHLAKLSSNVICKKKNLYENSQFRVAFFPYWVYTYIYICIHKKKVKVERERKKRFNLSNFIPAK